MSRVYCQYHRSCSGQFLSTISNQVTREILKRPFFFFFTPFRLTWLTIRSQKFCLFIVSCKFQWTIMIIKLYLLIKINQQKIRLSMSFLIFGNNTAKRTLVTGQRKRDYNRVFLTSLHFCCEMYFFNKDLEQVYLLFTLHFASFKRPFQHMK